ncbi:MAG: four helix bundle protein [Ignavibacteriaceae bacterium]|jgi:four helix bundle protein|nr:four helix bundle protein [Ignavibacteriaceae bacterium]
MKDFRSLKVWEKSHLIALEIYKLTRSFPKDEQYNLTSQLRRAITSISANIAEGCGRGSDKDFKRFIQIAMGSASESEYLILLTKDLNYISEADFNKLIIAVQEIKKMLSSLISKLKS